MTAWSFDADKVNPDEIPSSYIYTNSLIEDFLLSEPKERKLFLVGPKGCGKTLILRYKAYKYWDNTQSDPKAKYDKSASEALVEGLNLYPISFTNYALKQLSRLESWVKIWNFSLSYFVLQRTGIGLPNELSWISKKFDDTKNLSLIINCFLKDPEEFLSDRLLGNTDKLMSRIKTHLNHGFIYFIDRVDQAFNSILTNEDYIHLSDEDGNNIPFLIWKNAQYGLLEASYNLTINVQRHVKIFATARKEALMVKSQLRQNILDYCIELDYRKEELKEIFERNINSTPKKHLKYPNSNSPWKRFFGFEIMPHPTVRSEDGDALSEHVFDFIYRHTFGRPREIVMMGRNVYDKLLSRVGVPLEDDLGDYIENVRSIINAVAGDGILENYKTEFIPTFPDNYLEEFHAYVANNLLTKEDISQVREEALNFFFRTGLLGSIKRSKQFFILASVGMYDMRKTLPKSDYYFLHPCIDRLLQNNYSYEEFYNTSNIIGHGNNFSSPTNYNKQYLDGKPLEYFLPSKKPGELGWAVANLPENTELLFEKLFIDKTDEEFETEKHKRLSDVIHVLNIVAMLYFIDRVKTKFRINSKDFTKEVDRLKERLKLFNGVTNYTKKVEFVNEDGKKILLAKQFGRLVTAGLLRRTAMKPEKIHRVVNYFEYDIPGVSRIAAVKNFKKSFYLDGVSQKEKLNYNDKSKIEEGLSAYEKETLTRWWRDFFRHRLLAYSLFSIAHKEFLEQKSQGE